MAHGGKRIGAGRKPGGGIPVRQTLRSEARAVLAEIVGTERDPLLVAINIANDKDVPLLIRLEAALGTAKYLHPTLSAAQVQHLPAPAAPDAALARLQEQVERLAEAAGPVIEAEGSAVELTLEELGLGDPAPAEAA